MFFLPIKFTERDAHLLFEPILMCAHWPLLWCWNAGLGMTRRNNYNFQSGSPIFLVVPGPARASTSKRCQKKLIPLWTIHAFCVPSAPPVRSGPNEFRIAAQALQLEEQSLSIAYFLWEQCEKGTGFQMAWFAAMCKQRTDGIMWNAWKYMRLSA